VEILRAFRTKQDHIRGKVKSIARRAAV